MPPIKFELESKFGSQYGPEEEKTIIDILHKNAPTSGDACVQFEKDFAEYTGAKYARAVSNGTAALFLALKALDIKPGDRVLTTPLTWIATAAVGDTLGAEVDFVDIDPKTYNLDPNQLEKKLTPNTKALLPVHLYGQCCDMDALMGLAAKHDFAVVEDACHAIGAEYKGKKAGTIGALGCFSFHEQKNISTLGEGGMITTDDPELFERVALYRSHCARVYGKSTKYCTIDESKFPMGKKFWFQDFDDCGYNYRLTDIQGAVGSVQLKRLDALNQRRIDICHRLSKELASVAGLTLPEEVTPGKHVYHLYPIQLDAAAYGLGKEDFIAAMLNEKGIKIGTHYTPLHYSQAFQKRGFKRGQFPVAEAIGERLVTMPIHPRLTDDAVTYLIESIKSLAK